MSTSTQTKLTRFTTIVGLMLFAAACTPDQPTALQTPTPIASTQPAATPNAAATPAIASKADPFPKAEDKAISAANLARTAATVEDWDLVKSKLQQAIALMKTVPANSPKRAAAQKKLVAYQQQLKAAQQQRQALAKGNVPAKPRSLAQDEPAEMAVASVPALSGRGLDNYSRIQFGMSATEVRSLLGSPTREQGSSPNFSWTWESADKQTTVSISFYENKVAGKTCVSSSPTMRCFSKS